MKKELRFETSIVKDTKEELAAYLRKIADKIEMGEEQGMLNTYLQGYWWTVSDFKELED